MNRRRWIGILAVMGVLLHSAALVRHHGMMLPAGSLEPAVAALEADLATICHFSLDGTGSSGKTSQPVAGKNCPLCSGLASLFALPPPLQWLLPEPAVASFDYQLWLDQRVAQLKRIRPPGRGPPLLA